MMRGDVVLVDFPFATGSGSKKRPALVVQCDRNNGRLEDTIVAIITSNTGRASREPTQLIIDPAHADWAVSGLRLASVVKCEHLYTFHKQRVLRTIGQLGAATMLQINDCLKASLELP
jgi:mRNA-degrading endonuclease toxin of MazEF toxin-antitoxin module